MKNPPKISSMVSAFAISLAGCAAGGPSQGTAHLSPTQCRDLTALKHNAPITQELNRSQLAALEQAGYNPGRRFDPYYPKDLQDAQHKVDQWYQADCPQAQTQWRAPRQVDALHCSRLTASPRRISLIRARHSVFDRPSRLTTVLLGLPLLLPAVWVAMLIGCATFVLGVARALTRFLPDIATGATLLRLLRCRGHVWPDG
jgi:hypothetical protein